MSSALQTTSHAPLPTDDVDDLPSAPEKKTSLPSLFSRLFSTLKTASSALLPTRGVEGSFSVLGKKKMTLSSAFSWLVSPLRWHPFSSSIVIFLIIAGSVAGIVYRSYYQLESGSSQVNSNGVQLIGHSHRLDLVDRKLTIGWEIKGCGTYSAWSLPDYEIWCSTLNHAVDVYLFGASEPTFSYDPANLPFWRSPWDGSVTLHPMDDFEVDHSIGYSSLYMVPFDSYSFTATAFVIEKDTNKSVPIVKFAASEAADNFVISSSDMFDMKNNFTYNPGTGSRMIEVDSGMISVKAKRSPLAQAFTMCMLFTNWALTIGSIYITVTLLATTRKENMDAAVLLLPVTIVLIIPTLRDLYVGSPPFGIFIDTFGFFLQMIVVAVCSMVLLYTVALPGRVLKRQSSGNENAL